MHLDNRFPFHADFNIYKNVCVQISKETPGRVFKHPANYNKADLLFFFFDFYSQFDNLPLFVSKTLIHSWMKRHYCVQALSTTPSNMHILL